MSGEDMVGSEVVLEANKPSWISAGWKRRAELLALVSILLGASAQIILKGALLQWRTADIKLRLDPTAMPSLAGVLFGLFVYATGTLFWCKAVSRASISYLYPFSAVNYALVALCGRFFFGETIPSGRWMGIAVITAGVALQAFSSRGGDE